jgi:hypothetical protein
LLLSNGLGKYPRHTGYRGKPGGTQEVVTLLPLSRAEILKIASWSSTGVRLSRHRDKDQNDAGTIVALDVKASAAVSPDDFNGLRKVTQAAGRRSRRMTVPQILMLPNNQ